MKRLVIAIACLSCLAFASYESAKAGYARHLSARAREPHSSTLANRAVDLSGNDPEVHRDRATTLARFSDFESAATSLERATALSASNYASWLELAQSMELAGDIPGAGQALAKAIGCAPYYGEPRWRLGGFLLRHGETAKAFAEIRAAVQSNPSLLPAAIEMAWTEFNGDTVQVSSALQPNEFQRLVLARVFVQKGTIDAGLQLFRSTDSVDETERSSIVAALIRADRFPEAFEVWSRGREKLASRRESTDAVPIANADFESDVVAEEVGFGWQEMGHTPNVDVLQEFSNAQSGSRSLRVDWTGPTEAFLPVVTKMIIVAPGTSYRLDFFSRASELNADALPRVVVADISRDRNLLGQSEPLTSGVSGWREFTVDFTSPQNARAVQIMIWRDRCENEPCPIYGRTWFDNFRLTTRQGNSLEVSQLRSR